MEKIRKIENIVNLTEVPIYLYSEETGEIKGLDPVQVDSCKIIPDGRCFVVDSMNAILVLSRAGARIDDMALIGKKDEGRGGKIITFLNWAKDPTIPVRLK